MTKKEKDARRFRRYIRRTWKNKVWAGIWLLTGILSVLPDGDATWLVFTILPSTYLFFARNNVFEEEA
jgi:hypothetical protein